jgi:hypothetical protein
MPPNYPQGYFQFRSQFRSRQTNPQGYFQFRSQFRSRLTDPQGYFQLRAQFRSRLTDPLDWPQKQDCLSSNCQLFPILQNQNHQLSARPQW